MDIITNNGCENVENLSYMQRVIKTFCDEIRGKKQSDFTHPFWDVVVITTMDEEQKSATELQIKSKRNRFELPVDVPFIVIPDPEGPKIGNGGSTMHCLDQLEKIYGLDFYEKRILLIHAGGMSQRLPTVSVIGKLFQPFPLEPMLDALELVLCMYMPFIQKMNPGIFLVCPDAFTPFTLDCQPGPEWSFKEPGITALAHPSPVHIGTGHGVYVLEKGPTSDEMESSYFLRKCIKVLQKPTVKKMVEEDAVYNHKDGTEMIYSDSCFFMDSDVCKRLLEFYKVHKPLSCEIDAYGDFLQALGRRSDNSYASNIKNVLSKSKDLIQMRKNVFDCLRETELNLIVLNRSKFYHVGTLYELIENFCLDSSFIENFGLKHFVSSKVVGDKILKNFDGVVMQSVLNSESTVPSNSVISYCKFNVPVEVGRNNVISDCSVGSGDGGIVAIPDNIMLHTLPVVASGARNFVTVSFGIKDDFKNNRPVEELMFLGRPVGGILKKLGISEARAFDANSSTLWNLKIFSAKSNMEESFEATLNTVKFILGQNELFDVDKDQLLSMSEILRCKDTNGLVEFKGDLKETISAPKIL